MIRRAICPGCGLRFAIRHPLQKFCTRTCGARTRRAARYARYARTRFWGKCIVCDTKIDPPPARRPGHHQMYCSARCRLRAFRMRRKQRAEAALGRKIRRCAWCGLRLGAQAHALRKYCSKRCLWRAANSHR
jgi:hypothetical protein